MTSSSQVRPTPIPIEDLAQAAQASLQGSSDVLISGLSHLEGATCGDLSFVLKPKFHEVAKSSAAAAFLTAQPISDDPRPQLICPNPMLALITLAQKYFLPPLPERGIHPTAVTGHDVRIGPDVSIGPLVTIGDRVQIGSGVTIYAGVHIGDNTEIGDDCILYPHVSLLTNCILGHRVILHSGTIIGSDGFGYAQHEERHHKIPQLGNVVIEDDVELGANVTVDRATFGSTVIKQGTKVDNQVQIAHDTTIGKKCLIASQVGIAGCTRIEDEVTLWGQVGVISDITIGKGAVVYAQSGVNKHLEAGKTYFGSPAGEAREKFKELTALKMIPKIWEKLKK